MNRNVVLLSLVVLLVRPFEAGPADAADLPKQADKTRLHLTLEGHTDVVQGVAFNPVDPTQLASGGRDKTERDLSLVRFWDPSDGHCVLVASGLSGDVLTLAWSFDGNYLLTATANHYDKYTTANRAGPKVVLWDASRGRRIKDIPRATGGEVFAVAFSPDGRSFAMAGDANPIEFWSIDGGMHKTTFKKLLIGHSGIVLSIAFSSDSTRLASASADTTVRVWDPAKITEHCLKTMEGHVGSVNSVAFTPDVRFLVSGGSDRTVRIWDVITGQCLRTLKGHSGSVNAVAVTPDGRHLVSASNDRTVKIWDMAKAECIQTLTGHTGAIETLALSPDGNFLVTGGQDRTVRVWVMARYP